jgi:hypothetical protein
MGGLDWIFVWIWRKTHGVTQNYWRGCMTQRIMVLDFGALEILETWAYIHTTQRGIEKRRVRNNGVVL